MLPEKREARKAVGAAPDLDRDPLEKIASTPSLTSKHARGRL